MASEVGSGYVTLLPSARNFRRNLDREIGGDLDRSGREGGARYGRSFAGSTGRTLKSRFAAIGRVAAVGLAAGIGFAVVGLRGAINAASDLGETTSKVAQIFGKKALPALQKFAKGARSALGQSEQSALDAAATFAVFGKSAGLRGRDLTGFSKKLVRLSSDMASFSNTSPEDAITAIGAALRGESEPIRAYGVLLDDASLRQEALRQGLIKTTKQALTPQQRVLAAQALIFKQTADAQGDFARTSDGLANKQRILSATVDNLKVKLGRGLLPAVTGLVGGLTEFADGLETGQVKGEGFAGFMSGLGVTIRTEVLPRAQEFGRFLKTDVGPELVKFGGFLKTSVIPQLRVLASTVQSTVLPAVGPLLKAVTEIAQAFTGLPGPVQFAVLAFAGAGRAASLAAPGISRFTTSLRTARAEGGLLRGGLRGAMGLVGGPWGLAFAGAVGVLGSFAARNATAKARVNELAGALDQETGAVNRNTRAVVVNQLERDGTLKKARQFGLSLRDVTDASLGNEAAQRRVNDSLAAYVRSVDGANAGTRQAGLAGSDAREKVDLFKRSIGSANKALQDARTQQKRLRDAMRDTGSEAVSLGKNFTTSLAAGIRRGGDVAVAEAAGVANKINAQFARINEIHSPSKVWTRFGLALPAGLALGIRQGTGDAVDALTRMAQNLLDKAVARLDRVKARLGELRSELQALKSSVRDAVTGTLDVGSLRGGLGAMFDIKALASKAGAFVKALGNLARKGVAPGLIELIAQAGPDQGLAAAQSIAAMNKKQIKSVNADFNALGRYANQAANIAGNVSGLPEQIAQLKEIKEGVRALVRKRERDLNVFIELEDGSTPRRVRRKKLATAGAF